MKKLLVKFTNKRPSGLFILGLLMLGLTPLAARQLGDVDLDGAANIIDALMIAHYVVGPEFPLDTTAADVNCDDKITIVDALIVAQYYVGLITGFPCESMTVVISHDRGIQCETVLLATVEDARRQLQSAGIKVVTIIAQSVPVIALCGSWDGITYLALISRTDLAAAIALGWSRSSQTSL